MVDWKNLFEISCKNFDGAMPDHIIEVSAEDKASVDKILTEFKFDDNDTLKIAVDVVKE